MAAPSSSSMGPVLISGVDWATGEPTIRVVTESLDVSYLRLYGQTVSFRCAPEPSNRCVGRFEAGGKTSLAFVPCGKPIQSGRQCPECSYAEGFVAVHHARSENDVKKSLRPYLGQPHYVYVAAVADGQLKVGTAAESRKKDRLAEQGAVAALYVATCKDGYLARQVETVISERLGLGQTISKTHKLRALAKPLPHNVVVEQCDAAAARARAFLANMTMEGLTLIDDQRFELPLCASSFFDGVEARAYPDSLTKGQHSVVIDAALGTVVLLHVSESKRPIEFIADISELIGYQVEFGNFASDVQVVQDRLF